MKPHVIIIHRWRARYAEYERYLDHNQYAVTYVTTEVGASAVPPAATEVTLVAATDDLASVADRIKELVERHGQPHAIVALKEDDLLVAAQLRQDWGCAGQSLHDLLPFRDKMVMAEKVAAAGVEIPAFAPAPHAGAVREFGERHGYPLIIKPRIGSSSDRVSQLEAPTDADQVDYDNDGPFLVQAFDGRQIYHVDGYFDGVALGPFQPSRYVNTTPLGFRFGEILGSVEEDDPALVAAIGAFSERAMAALTDRPTVFHLEVFVDRRTGSCAFLEVGARVGGGETPFIWREIHGYDLMEVGFRVALGLAPRPWPVAGGEVAGFLLVPAPATRPCRIIEATPMLGHTPSLYAEALLAPGEIMPAADAYYEHVGGRFRFRGPSAADVEAGIVATAREYRVRAEPIPA